MTIQEELAREPVGSLPLRSAVPVHRHTLARAAIAQMRSHQLGCAVIVKLDRTPTGIFTEQSVISMLVQNASLDDVPVSEFAERNLLVVQSNEPIYRVWQAVQQREARFVCVTNNAGQLVGLTGQRGLAEYLSDAFAAQTTIQRIGCKPWLQQREGA